MIRVRILSIVLAVCCLLGFGAAAAEVDCDAVYCFTGQEFSQNEEPLAGVCITELPDATAGTVLLGTRVLRTGDILTAQQLAAMSFHPLRTEEDAQALGAEVAEMFGDLDVEVQYGGQPLYYYLISAE